jgi:phosphatidylserine/phosphatidylglycerophosphate/cardiolipin synthase-like enzyme/uncharacterized membrane protein YdjX (TVP38/TMEM64 family)
MKAIPGEPTIRLLREGDTCVQVVKADRAAVLVEASVYYGALRQALLNARHHAVICGWDVDGRMRLVGPAGRAEDGAPETLREFLAYLVERRPELTVDVLLWNFTSLYTFDREAFPSINLGWLTPSSIRLTLDSEVPAEASHHQKIVVIDDRIAFCGGIDLAIRRWDTAEHLSRDARRVDPAGAGYGPFHDVQMLVDGAAARALGDVAEERWLRCRTSIGEPLRTPVRIDGYSVDAPSTDDPWPASVTPHFRDATVGVARTLAAQEGHSEVREVERLYHRSIAAARRFIYIENQYLTALPIADALADRLTEVPELEALIVVPKANDGFVERHTMGIGRRRFLRRLEKRGVAGRVAVVTPVVPDADGSDGSGGRHVRVHSKLMIVDDRLLRVGSANLNNRSMGLDTECDLAIEADSAEQRTMIAGIRNRLLAEHQACTEVDVAQALAGPGPRLAAVLALARSGRRLEPLDIAAEPPLLADPQDLKPLLILADPNRPLTIDGLMPEEAAVAASGSRALWPRLRLWAKRYYAAVAMLATASVLAVAWHATPLAALADVSTVERWLTAFAQAPWGLPAALAAFVGLALLVFPVTVLIVATAAVFGPLLGFACALAGSLGSAALGYGGGMRIGHRFLRNAGGPMARRVGEALGRHGILTVIVLRLIPVAPFTMINLLAGASHISFRDFMVGTVIGMTPGVAVTAVVGSSLADLWRSPDGKSIAWFAFVCVLAAAWTLAVHRFVSRRARSGSRDGRNLRRA